MPGNVALRKSEANLPRSCVVNVSQLRTVDRDRLTELVGRLSPRRLAEVMSGVGLVFGARTPAAIRVASHRSARPPASGRAPEVPRRLEWAFGARHGYA
jgi:PemK-like, MazF-like toxin of type II toxin-antitoxin system